ncbi:MAG: DNA methyltransferase [Christensenellales bacterium]
MLSWMEIDTRAAAFAARWRDCSGDERQYGQTFEKDFMQVFGVDWLDGFHEYQLRLLDGSIAYVDYLLPGKILIEMKSRGKSLPMAYSQAMSYVRALKPEEAPALVMVCDFDQVQVYSLKKDHPYKPFRVRQLRQHTRIFSLLAGYGTQDEEATEIEVNTAASYKMARIHDALKENGYSGHALEVFLVRLLFCLFADDTGIFEKDSFQRYIAASREDGSDLSMRLGELFWVLNTPEHQRMKTLSDELKRFRYINGSIFRDPLPPASFNSKMRSALIEVSREFDWTQISPSIFGAMFQGVMDQEARRALGAHYTSQENILKLIRPLFLDELYDEFERSKATTRELKAFQDNLASLSFLDPACGSGNFLIVTYQELRRLEFEVLKLLHEGHQMAWVDALVKVKPGQFYGIEIEDFACQVAQMSMLLMKHLMDREVGDYFGVNIIDFPIRENANIVHGNALRLDWNEVCRADKLGYIIGNPPFVGGMQMNSQQKADMKDLLGHVKGYGEMDYVCAWYYRASQYIRNFPIRCAFVSTNSICQGQQVITFWSEMIEKQEIKIDFAYTSFVWSNLAKGLARVHCVIISFSKCALFPDTKHIITEDSIIEAQNINPYLMDAPNIFLHSISRPLCDVSPMRFGSMPRDGGHFILSAENKEELERECPIAEGWIRPYLGSNEFINKEDRWCLWLVGVGPGEIRKCPIVVERVEKVKEFRQNSIAAGTRKFAKTPTLFCQIAQPTSGQYLVIPKVSSEKRRYIPIGVLDAHTIASDLLFIVPNATLYEFGVLASNVHMAWMRTVAGRLEMRYRYSKDIVYNNFIWPDCTPEQKAKIEHTAEGILDARAKYPNDTYADLYDDTVMPPDLRRAHQENDRAVWEAYGRAWPIGDESACVAHLMKLYQQRTAKTAEAEGEGN